MTPSTLSDSNFTGDSVCKANESKSIFNLPALNEINKGNRYVFTTHNGTRLVQLETSTKFLRWSFVNSDNYNSMPINIPEDCSDIIDVIISKNAKFVAFYTSNDICLIEIPWLYKSISDTKSVFQKKIANINKISKIKKVLFHPKAFNDTCMVILFQDDSIWLYDLNTNNKIILNDDTGKFGLGGKVTSITDMEFSNDGLNLYVLSASGGGDIYSLYPCLPSRLLISDNEIQTLISKSVILYNSIDKDTKPEVKRNIIKQVQFAAQLDIKKKKKNCADGIEIEDEYRFVKLQGPFTIAPYPNKLYDTTAKEISVVNIDQDNELLAMMFDDNTLLFLFKDLEQSMVWDSFDFYYNNSLVLIEDLQLSTKDNCRIIKSFIKMGSILVHDSRNIFLIDTTSWSSLVSKCIIKQDMTPLTNILFNSKVTPLNWNDKFLSAGVWKSNGVEGLLVSSPLKIYAKKLSTNTTAYISRGNAVKSELEQNNINKNVKYSVSFSQPISEIMDLTKMYIEECKNPFPDIIEPRVRQEVLSNDSNEEQLEVMTKLSGVVMKKIIKGQSLGITLHSRILEQEYELTRQLKYAQDLIAKQATIEDLNQQQSLRWKQRLEKQVKLIDRFKKLNEKLTAIESNDKFKDLVISNAEMAWFKEIKNQAIKFNDFVHKQKNVQEDLDFIKKELELIQSKSQALETKAQNEWESLRQMLKEDSILLNKPYLTSESK